MLSTLALLLAAASPARLDACTLLDARTIAQVQGAAPASSHSSEQPRGSLTAALCYFALPDASRSVALEVTRAATAGQKKDLRERWERVSGAERERDEQEEKAGRGKKGGEEEDEKGPPPRKVKGVGREAVWSGNEKAGVLYVLDRGAIVRVSVGGKATVDEKIAACSKLARAALKKLPASR